MFDTFAYLITSLRKDFTEFCNEKLQEMGLTLNCSNLCGQYKKRSYEDNI